MNIICEMNYGSTLYGTNTKESDIDIKGIFMPSVDQILLGRIPKNITERTNKSNKKNTNKDIEKDFYSIHYFIELACSGQTVALDMLNCNKENLLKTSLIWENMVQNKNKFCSKRMKAFVGYARSQAAKYGVKGDRITSAKKLRIYFNQYSKWIKLNNIWSDIKKLELEHLHFKDGAIRAGGESVNELVICGKIIQETVTIEYAMNVLDNFISKYGKRAKMAEENKGIDWKAISHSIRIASELKEIYETGNITFPLHNSKLITNIKQGKLDYKSQVAPILDNLMEEIEILSNKCDFPEKVDRKFWDDWLITYVFSYHFDEFEARVRF